MSDSTKTIYLSAARFFSGTMLSRITGMLRDMAMAFAFGTEPLIALFMVAFRFAHLARRLFGEGTLQNTFIPHFEELRRQSNIKALAFFRDLSALIWIIIAAGITATVFSFFALSSFFTFSDETALLLKLTCLMLPSLFFICQFGLSMALLECEKSYFTPSVAPVAFNLVWIAFALLLIEVSPAVAVTYLSIGVCIACFAQFAITLPKTLQIIQQMGGKDFWSAISPFSADVKRLIFPLFLANLGVAASQINNAIDPLFALFAESEGPAFLWYALRVQQLPLALFGVALTGALLPPISRAVKAGDLTRFNDYFLDAEFKLVTVTSLIAAGAIITAPSCINLLFGRGEFGMESVAGTSLCLMAYALGLPFMAYILIAAPTLYAFNDYKSPMRASIASMFLSFFLNGVFIFGFGFGAVSVALSTSIAAAFNALWIRHHLKQKTTALPSLKRFFPALFIALAGVAAVAITDLLLFDTFFALDLFTDSITLPRNLLNQLFQFCAEALAFLLACLLSLSPLIWKQKTNMI